MIAAALKAIGAFLDALPGWIYASVIVAIGVYHVGSMALIGHDLANLTKAHSALVTQTALDTAERERVARVDAEQVARSQFRHAESQQENTNENAKRTAVRMAADRSAAADTRRLRDIVRAYASAGRGGGKDQSDATACGRDDDRPGRLGGLVEEALDLLRESESFIRQRDDEVKRLLDQIATDRAALGAQ